jgi:hypothetical protein
MGRARPLRPLTLDAGALIAFDRGGRAVRRTVERAAARGLQIVIPAGALGQAWRDGRKQARLSRLLREEVVTVESPDEPAARDAGELCGRRGTSDVIDASVVIAARGSRARVLTSDPDDLRRVDPLLDLEAV